MLSCEVAECGVSFDRLDIKCRNMAVANSCLDVRVCAHFWKAAQTIVVTTGIKPSSNIGSALVSTMYRRSSELGLYLWGN